VKDYSNSEFQGRPI